MIISCVPFSRRFAEAGTKIIWSTILAAAFVLHPSDGSAETTDTLDATHVTIRHEGGRYFGWPANGGIWAWGDEILVQYRHGTFLDKSVGSHDLDHEQPITIDQSRSLDRGRTWTHQTTSIASTEISKTSESDGSTPPAGGGLPIIANQVVDACPPVSFQAWRLDPQSYLGRRVDINFRTGLLSTFDIDLYLDSYGEKPEWPSGEYLGKFVQGLSAMVRTNGDSRTRDRLDRIIAQWRQVQADDGWLGTTERFKSWDIWEHKYVLLGLLEYYALTGDDNALDAARQIGDLLCRHVGPGLGDIMHSGHWAMGSASILEPMVYLYRMTGEAKYLRFCQYIVDALDGPTGPKLITTLTSGSKRVCDIEDPWANRPVREIKFRDSLGQVRNRSKAYEMLSCLIGLARMHQLTEEPKYRDAAINAWQDIADHRLYVAGSSDADECFKDDGCLPADKSDGAAEACVTAHWIYLSRVLFEITGDVRYADAVETSLYNYLLASQRPQDCYQSYNTSLNGSKTFARHAPQDASESAPCCMRTRIFQPPAKCCCEFSRKDPLCFACHSEFPVGHVTGGLPLPDKPIAVLQANSCTLIGSGNVAMWCM